MKSIRSRIEHTLIAAALIPIGLIALYVYLSTHQTLTNSGIESSNRQVELLASSVEGTLAHVPGDLFYLRDSNSMHHYGRALVINDAKAKEEYGRSIARDFLSIAKNRRIYNQIRFIGADGKELIRVEHNEKEGNSRILQSELLQDKSQSIHFNNTAKLNFGDYYISPIDLNREAGEIEKPIRPTIRFATPIFAVGERFVGEIILNVDADAFLSMVRNANNTKGLSFALSDVDGYLMENQNPALNWGSSLNLAHGGNLKQLISANVVQQITESQNFTTLESDDKLITARPLFASTGQQQPMGYLVAFAEKSTVLKLLDHFLIAFAIFFGLAVITAVIIARVLSSTMTAPLIYLTQAADRLSKGDMNTEIQINSGDEIQSLAEAFERLRESVKLLMKLG
jgi:methyl-accepting chemotaxis protein